MRTVHFFIWFSDQSADMKAKGNIYTGNKSLAINRQSQDADMLDKEARRAAPIASFE